MSIFDAIKAIIALEEIQLIVHVNMLHTFIPIISKITSFKPNCVLCQTIKKVNLRAKNYSPQLSSHPF